MKRAISAALTVAVAIVLLWVPSPRTATADTEFSISDAVRRALEESPILTLAEVRRDRKRKEWQQLRNVQDDLDDLEDLLGVAELEFSMLPRQARTEYRIARAEVEATEKDLEMQVEMAFRAAQTAETMRRPARLATRVAADALRTAEAMYEEDMINRAELLEAEAGVEAAMTLSAEVSAQKEQAIRTLKQLMDYPERQDLAISDRHPIYEPLDDINLSAKVEEAQDNRFEMVEMEERIDLAEYRQRNVEAEDDYAQDIADLQVREAKLGRRILEDQIEAEVRNLYTDIRTQERVLKEREAFSLVAIEEYRRVLLMQQEDKATRLELLNAYADRLMSEAEYMVQLHTHEMMKLQFHHTYSSGSSPDRAAPADEGERQQMSMPAGAVGDMAGDDDIGAELMGTDVGQDLYDLSDIDPDDLGQSLDLQDISDMDVYDMDNTDDGEDRDGF